MKRQIKKETLKEAIRLAIKHHKNRDIDFHTLTLRQCEYISQQAFNTNYDWVNFSSIITEIAYFRERRNLPITYETFYKVFELLGFEIVDGEVYQQTYLEIPVEVA